MALEAEQEVGRAARGGGLPGVGLLKGLAVTLKHLLRPSITQEYPDEKPSLPPRTRGVIALKAENCTVCWKCSRECPDWCIYIEAHKETHEPASGGRARSVKVLDRFAIDYALCMYCGICVEVCPFDALFWSPEFEYAEYNIVDLIHEKERLEEWTYKVLPPPPLEEGAEPPEEAEEAPAARAERAAPAAAPARPLEPVGAPAAGWPPSVAAAPAAAQAAPPAVAAPAAPAPEAAPAPAAAPAAPAPEAAPATAAPRPEARAAPREAHVEPDPATYERVLAEELAKGTDRRVAEGRAKAAAVRAARAKARG